MSIISSAGTRHRAISNLFIPSISKVWKSLSVSPLPQPAALKSSADSETAKIIEDFLRDSSAINWKNMLPSKISEKVINRTISDTSRQFVPKTII